MIDQPPAAVWRAVQSCRWNDLTWSRLLFAVRGLWSLRGRQARLVDGGPVAVVLSDEPRYLAGVRVARPWQPVPTRGPAVRDLAELRDLDEPGWLKLGLDFALTELPDGRTLLETRTVCEATDDAARRRFRPCWSLIRPFSGLIRLEMLRVIAHQAAGNRGARRP